MLKIKLPDLAYISDISSFLKALFVSVLFASFISTMANAVGFTMPYDNFLYPGIAAFNDFFEVMNYVYITHTWDLPSIYAEKGINFLPPFCIGIYAVCALIIKYLHISKFIVFLIVFLAPLAIILKKSKYFANKSKWWFLILFSYPILFVVTRGNVAILVFLFLVLSILYADKIALSMLFLAIAVSIKVTPVIFIIYFIANYGNLKKILISVLLFSVFLFLLNYLAIIFIAKTVAPTAYNPFNFFESIAVYDSWMLYKFGGLGYCSSFYLPFRFIAYKVYNYTHSSLFELILNAKPLLINFLVLIILLLIYLYKHSLKLLFQMILDKNKMLKVACIIFILFTPITNDYYLTLLFLPLFFIPFDQFTLPEKVILLLILIPKNFIYFNKAAISPQVFINPVLLMAWLLIVTDIYSFNFIGEGLKTRRMATE